MIANGLTAERLLKHVEEIRKISDRLKGITLLAGCEVDILADGRMDFEDEILAELDIVIGSPHVALKQDEAKATDRLLRHRQSLRERDRPSHGPFDQQSEGFRWISPGFSRPPRPAVLALEITPATRRST